MQGGLLLISERVAFAFPFDFNLRFVIDDRAGWMSIGMTHIETICGPRLAAFNWYPMFLTVHDWMIATHDQANRTQSVGKFLAKIQGRPDEFGLPTSQGGSISIRAYIPGLRSIIPSRSSCLCSSSFTVGNCQVLTSGFRLGCSLRGF